MSLKLRILAGLVLLFATNGAYAAKEINRDPGPVRLDAEGESWAQNTLRRLTLEQKIGQMLVIASKAQFFNDRSPQYQQLRQTIRRYQIGGVGLTVPVDSGQLQRVMPYEAAALTNQMQG